MIVPYVMVAPIAAELWFDKCYRLLRAINSVAFS